MKKRNKKHEKRMKKLVVGCGLCAILLTVATYAWFIGMKTVNVSAFDVEIAAIDGLELSLTGGANNDWATTVTINEDNYDSTYGTNTNSWGGEKGLIPMSSVGVIDTSSSKLKILYLTLIGFKLADVLEIYKYVLTSALLVPFKLVLLENTLRTVIAFLGFSILKVIKPKLISLEKSLSLI